MSPSDAAGGVRIALVGAGRMGRVHLRALQSSELVALAGVVEPFAANREAVAAEGIATFETVAELLDGSPPDGILVAAPSNRHRELAAQVLAAGVPLLCEKPLGVSPAETLEVARAAERAGVRLQVGYWRRFVPVLRRLRERIAAGELGQIYQVSCMQWDAEPPNPQFRASSGGIAIDMAVHEIDQIRWLLGQDIDWVSAAGSGWAGGDFGPPADPDAATILAGLSGGAAATISLGRRFPHLDSCWVEVWGSAGYDRITFMWGTDGDQVFLDAMVAQAESFARTIQGAARQGAGGADAVAAITAAELITRSLSADGERRRSAG